jgi:hypothetical protein
MGSPDMKKLETKDLNPSPIARNKSCKEMSYKPERTLSLEEAFPTATTA